MHLAETLTLDKAISAQGTLAVTDDEGSSGALIGFFNESSEGWRTPNSLAFRVDGNGGNYWLFFEYGTRNGKTGGMGVFEGERYQTTKTRPFDADGTMHTWQLHYDPMAGDYGMLNFQVDGKDYSIELTKEARSDGAQFNRFGLWNQQTTGNGLELWIDELFVQGKPASFDSDPKWISENNRSTFQPAAVRPFHDYGFETDAKSIRGVIWRDETPSYCAKPIARLTLKQPLRASGRIRLNQAAADSGLYLGWFDSETKRKNDHPNTSVASATTLRSTLKAPVELGIMSGRDTARKQAGDAMRRAVPFCLQMAYGISGRSTIIQKSDSSRPRWMSRRCPSNWTKKISRMAPCLTALGSSTTSPEAGTSTLRSSNWSSPK